MTRMTGPDCVVICKLINTHTHIHRQLRSLGPVSVQMHRTEGVTGSEGREGANEVGGGVGVGGGNGDGDGVGGGNGDVNGHGDGAGAGTERERERERVWK